MFYFAELIMRVRDGRTASTRARILDHMRFRSSRRIVVKKAIPIPFQRALPDGERNRTS